MEQIYINEFGEWVVSDECNHDDATLELMEWLDAELLNPEDEDYDI